MNYLPAPWVPFIRETGPDWGSDINKLDLERLSQRTKNRRDGELWPGGGLLGTEYIVQAGLSLNLCRAARARSFGSGWISAEFAFTPRKAGIVNFSRTLARPRPFVPAFPSFVKQAPGGRSFSRKPLPLHREAPR